MKPNGISAINAEFIMTTPETWLLFGGRSGVGWFQGLLEQVSQVTFPFSPHLWMCAAGTKWVPSSDSFLFLTPRRKCLSWGGKSYFERCWMCGTGLDSHLFPLFSLFIFFREYILCWESKFTLLRAKWESSLALGWNVKGWMQKGAYFNIGFNVMIIAQAG